MTDGSKTEERRVWTPGKEVSADRWGKAMADVASLAKPSTMTGQLLTERLAVLETVHRDALAADEEHIRILLEASIADREAFDQLVPEDVHGDPVSPGDVMDFGGDVWSVAGVDDRGGIFYSDPDDGEWKYTDARLGRVVLTYAEIHNAPSLRELAREIRDRWEDPERGINQDAGDAMGEAIDRLVGILEAISANERGKERGDE